MYTSMHRCQWRREGIMHLKRSNMKQWYRVKHVDWMSAVPESCQSGSRVAFQAAGGMRHQVKNLKISLTVPESKAITVQVPGFISAILATGLYDPAGNDTRVAGRSLVLCLPPCSRRCDVDGFEVAIAGRCCVCVRSDMCDVEGRDVEM